MDYNVETAKLLGSPDGYGWTQIHEFTPDDDEKLRLRGILLAVIAVRSKNFLEGTEQVRQGREVLARLHEEYYGRVEGSAFVSLSRAIKVVAGEFAGEGIEIEIAAAAVVGGIICLGSFGGAKGYLLRQGKLYDLLRKGGEEGSESVSGRVVKGDVFLLGTSSFFEEFSLGMVRGVLSGGITGFTETMAPTLHTKVNVGGVGALVGEMVIGDEVRQGVSIDQGKRETSRVKTGLVGFIDTLLRRLPERGVRGRGMQVKPDTIDMETKAKRRMAPLVGLMLLVLLVVSMVFGIMQRREKTNREKYEERLTEAIHQYEEAYELSSLNKSRARELVVAARETVRVLKDEGVKDERLDELGAKISANLGEIAGIYEEEEKLFLDLGLIASGFSGEGLTMSEGEMIILDKDERQVVSVDAVTKKMEVVAGPEYLADALDVALYAGRVFVLSSDGVREVGEEVELLIKPDWDPGRILMAAFAGNVYILEKDNGKIWRYPGIRLGFAEKQDWLPASVTPDFREVIAWVIDGSVWVLKEDGVLLYSQGSPRNFNLSGLGETAYHFSDIFTDEGQDLYLLDKQGSRVMKFNKEGEYQGEYLNGKLGLAEDIVVSETEKKIIFLAENKLWEIDLGGDGGI